MNKERLDKLNELLKNSYEIKSDLTSEHGIKIVNRLTGRERKIRYRKNQYVVSMTCKVDMKDYMYSIRELQAWTRGENILDRRFKKDNTTFRRRFKKDNTTFRICKICNLDYPEDEMRGKICYLCKEEMSKTKMIDKIKILV